MPTLPAIQPDASLLTVVEAASGERVAACYQCRKCTCGCPLAFAMDVMPNQVMQMIALGMEDELLRSRTIWICASCQTCTTRCPNGIDVAHVMDTLRQRCLASGRTPAEENVARFHQAFLDSVRRRGRVFELEMMGRYKLAARDPLRDARLAWQMLKRGKLKFVPQHVEGRDEIRAMFEK